VILWGSISGLAYSSVLLVDSCNFFVHYDVCGEISSCSASPTFTSLCPRDGKGLDTRGRSRLRRVPSRRTVTDRTDAAQHVCIQHVPNNSGSDRAPRPYGAATKSAPRAPVQRLVAETCPADLTIRSCQKHSLNHTYYACLALVVCPSLLAESSPARLLRCRRPFAFVNSVQRLEGAPRQHPRRLLPRV
jgi:hypothetical protein